LNSARRSNLYTSSSPSNDEDVSFTKLLEWRNARDSVILDRLSYIKSNTKIPTNENYQEAFTAIKNKIDAALVKIT
jgi:hypothetical protein